MGCSMFDAARAVVIAGIQLRSPELARSETRVQLFLRTYGPDLPAERSAAFIERLRAGKSR